MFCCISSHYIDICTSGLSLLRFFPWYQYSLLVISFSRSSSYLSAHRFFFVFSRNQFPSSSSFRTSSSSSPFLISLLLHRYGASQFRLPIHLILVHRPFPFFHHHIFLVFFLLSHILLFTFVPLTVVLQHLRSVDGKHLQCDCSHSKNQHRPFVAQGSATRVSLPTSCHRDLTLPHVGCANSVTGFASTATLAGLVSFNLTDFLGGGSVTGAHIGHCTSGSGGRSGYWALVRGIIRSGSL